MLEDFVDVRGGGLLVLGGARSFSRRRLGGHAAVGRAAGRARSRRARSRCHPPLELVVRPTPRGRSRIPPTQIADTAEDAAAKWRDLPPLTSVNPCRSRAQARRERAADRRRRARPRAGGAGLSALRPRQDARAARAGHLAVAHARQDGRRGHDAPHLLAAARALAGRRRAGSRDGDGDARPRAEGRAGHADGRGRRPGISRASTTAGSPRTSPRRRARSKTCRWSGRSSTTANTARGSRRPRTASTRSPSTARARRARTSAAAPSYLRVAPSDAEYFDAAMRAPLLRRIAEETEGRFFRAADTTRPRRRDHLQRQGRHGRRRARAVGHADHPAPAARADGRRVDVSAVAGAGVKSDACVAACALAGVGLALVAGDDARSRSAAAFGGMLRAVLLRQRAATTASSCSCG